MKYLTILEKTQTGYSIYSPDLPGCVATGETREEVQNNMREAVEFHVEGLQIGGYEIPQPSTVSSYIKVAA